MALLLKEQGVELRKCAPGPSFGILSAKRDRRVWREPHDSGLETLLLEAAGRQGAPSSATGSEQRRCRLRHHRRPLR